MIKARFKIRNISAIRLKNYLLLGGEIVDGSITKGMQILHETEAIPISDIGFMDRLNNDSSASLSSIILKFADEKELQKLRDLFEIGQIISIE